ncbi:hypothetical protein DSCW_33750 [Desulfosarcina widdelii]|uniref:Lipoprotein n=1 Tax=Desulfosarcina widdelii TaxID=947919 RepID=A0A5K7Z4M8_9BACT|nr:hypothetical protein [Desulfosarcina widdelii]BBO75958.1 hypothetical protein DSCW_33750 [Desulfosarcina widdelii]
MRKQAEPNTKSEPNRFCAILLLGLFFMAGCALPQHYWPQKDIAASGENTIPGHPTVLVASRDSEYKEQLVKELQKELSAAKISHIIIGVSPLEKIDPNDYAVIVIINTCLAWGLDDEVSDFLNRQQSTGNIILFTTSAEGTWLPDEGGRDFDAISGASVKENVHDVARDIMAKIQERLSHENQL